MKTFIITDDVAEMILLRHDESNGAWVLVSESKIDEKPRCATVLNPEEAHTVAETILREEKK